MKYRTAIGSFMAIWSAGIWGAIIVAFSQFLLRKLFRLDHFNVANFIGWFILEMTIVILGMYLIFGESKEPLLSEVAIVTRYTTSLAILPYILACLLIALYKSNHALTHSSTQTIAIEEDNGKIALHVKPEHMLYIKSENNYTSVVYLSGNKVHRKLVRATLKKLEHQIPYPKLIRVHRSYMVNLSHISSVNREKGGYQIKLDQLEGLVIRVSNSYKKQFESELV